MQASLDIEINISFSFIFSQKLIYQHKFLNKEDQNFNLNIKYIRYAFIDICLHIFSPRHQNQNSMGKENPHHPRDNDAKCQTEQKQAKSQIQTVKQAG